jgi:cytochrome c oxidase assembly protein subunit 11
MDRGIDRANRRLALGMVLVACGMLGFGFALAPLYNVFCRVTGLNGKTVGHPVTGPLVEDPSRWVRVQLMAYTPGALAGWTFRPEQPELLVHPGRTYATRFVARNPDPAPRTVRAVPSVAPGLAARYLRKAQCFCFSRQAFAPGEERELHLVFAIDPGLPRRYGTLSLAYTLFEADHGNQGGG